MNLKPATTRSAAGKAAALACQLAAGILLPRPAAPLDPRRVRNVLIYATFGVGNMILFTPALKAIRKRFAGAHIALLTGPSGGEETISGGGLADEFIKFNPSHGEIFKLAASLRKKRYDLLVCPFLCRSKYQIELALLSGIPYRAGHCSGPDWNGETDYLFNIPAPMRGNDHEMETHFRLAEALGCDTADKSLYVHIDGEAEDFAKRFFDGAGLSGSDWILAVQVGTGKTQSWKQWDTLKLAQACDRLAGDYGIKIVLMGSADCRDTLDELLRQMRHSPIIALGRTTIGQTAAALKRCDAALCNDSGLMHIAAAAGVPVIGVIGPTDPRRTGPLGTGHVLIRKVQPCSPCYTLPDLNATAARTCEHHNCLNSISAEDIVSAIKQMRESAGTRSPRSPEK